MAPQDIERQGSKEIKKPAPDMPPKAAFSVDEAAHVAGIGRVTLYKEINAGRLRAVKVGRRTLIPADAIPEWLASLEQAGPGRPAAEA